MNFWRAFMLMWLAVSLAGCGINNIPTYDEQVKAAWSQVQNQYQRRADLVPNLVNTVQGFADQEREVLVEVTEARSKVGSIQMDESILDDPEKFQQFEQAQSQLGSALQRLMVVVERYPDLKSNQNFLALQSQLEGTENRISIARRDYNEAVRNYNLEFKTFPNSFWTVVHRSSKPMQMFAASEAAQSAPTVSFAPAGPAPQAPATAPAPAQ